VGATNLGQSDNSNTSPDSYPRQYARTGRFTSGEPRSVHLVERSGDQGTDGSDILFLRSRSGTDSVNCLWRVSASADGLGDEQLLVDPQVIANGTDLPPAERARRERMREQASGITAFSVSTDGNVAVFMLGGQVVLADISDRASGPAPLRVLETPEGCFDAQLSPDGTFVAYVHDGDLHVIHVAGADMTLAHDEDEHVTWGMADFNAAEEFDRFRGHWWAPDSQRLVVARVDNNPVQSWWIADPAHPSRPAVEHRYPAAGTDNALVTLWIIGIDGTQTLIDLADVHDDDAEYILDVQWTKLGLIVTTLDRTQTDQRVIAVADDGSCRQLHHVAGQPWVELVPGTPLQSEHKSNGSDSTGVLIHTADVLQGEHGDRVLVSIDSDGSQSTCSPATLLINRVVRVMADGQILCCVTDREVGSMFTSVVAIRSSTEFSTFAGGPQDTGVHGVAAATERTVVIRSASLDRPRAEHRVFFDNTVVGTLQSFAESPLGDPQPTFLKAGIRKIPVAVLLPSNPEWNQPGVRLPVIMNPYAGPHAAQVIATRAAMASSQWLADQGFAVVVVDGRGTPGIGPVFERAVHLDFAGPVLTDQVVGLLDAAAQFPQLDLSRVGIRGWSFGGYTAALAVLRRPDVFHCAVVGAPVIDWLLYDTGYTERYLGHPTDDADAYQRSSLLDEAANLTRPIQLIHGLADDNVVAAHSLRFSSALVAAGIPHEVLPLSGVTHMTPQEEVAENMLLLQVDFLRRQLGVPQYV
jgi:dipeptidyl-peptidase 4